MEKYITQNGIKYGLCGEQYYMKKNEMFKHVVAIRTAKNNSIYAGTGFL